MNHPSTPSHRLRIVDAHVHFYDSDVNRHGFLHQKDDVYEALVGDYSSLPKIYLLDGYLKQSQSCQVDGIIWHEYLSDDALKEARWAQHLAQASAVPLAMVALVDFLAPRLEERLEVYRSLPNVTAVREHLGWDGANPLKRFAKRSDLLSDPAWQRGIAHLRDHDLKCGLEVFAPQLPDLLKVVRLYPDIGFTLAVLAWPLDLGPQGFAQWKQDLSELCRCDNVCADISAIECIFGMGWTLAQVSPWVKALIEMFGPNRCMFGSHLPIANLSYGFEPLYDAYQQMVAGFSENERDQMFRGVAMDWFRVR
ncbi:Predicted metal-dependent hydrolase, TIM-barrel fold [Bradyrhizobium lablabi]|uniref:Predicted metal-dependent hydrolase, TIM-barrel fold n=1 Tax=Bradyrhizobium lablabi TaxID=722472 RepID=A0A1M6Y1D7_9BRAD|nr:amidohydrolase family protein [Bradyrhizobium lablabi]SHL12040.1 Predicted metal-dependent hydrolase, TIM-barrel fold [Bradyrhizobium lablabi]